MSLSEQLRTRCNFQQLKDKDGNPTDAGVLNVSRLYQFLTPHYFRRKTDEGWQVRGEWLGFYEDGEGQDVFKVERELIEKIAGRLATEASKAAIVTKLKNDQ